MKTIKVKTPAKINYTIEILNRREDGFHNIQSIMQAISLYDYLSFNLDFSEKTQINLSGNSDKIPYDSSNLIYKAAEKFIEQIGIKGIKLDIYIEKNIPVAAGLAGGSTNASGTFYALNKLFNDALSYDEINELCASLGSDLNFCLQGGCSLCTSRGEVLEKLPTYKQKVSLIKPKNLGISAKEAYMNFAKLEDKSIPDNTSKLKKLLIEGKFDNKLLYNSLEKALFPYYEELRTIKTNIKGSLMSGSGSTFFVIKDRIETILDCNNYDIFENLETVETGVEEV